MSLTLEQVKKIAQLARIKMSEKEIERYTDELNKIFSWIEQLQEVNTDDIEPLYSIESHESPLRDDIVNDGNISEKILKNTTSKYGYFVVPKVVE